MRHNFTQKLTTITLATLLFSACQTVPDQEGKKKATSDRKVSTTWDALSLEPVSIGAAIGGARVVLMDYDRKLSKADKTRRGFNLASIASTTYTAVGAALNVHNHNLIVSTALSTILPSLEENVQSHGKPQTLGSAMIKTQCVIRAGTLALAPKTLEAAAQIRAETEEKSISKHEKPLAALAAYDGVKDHIVSGYGQVYIDYAANRTPAQLSAKELAAALNEKSEQENEAQNAADAETVAAATELLVDDGTDKSKRPLGGRPVSSNSVRDLTAQSAILITAAEASISAITDCTKSD